MNTERGWPLWSTFSLLYPQGMVLTEKSAGLVRPMNVHSPRAGASPGCATGTAGRSPVDTDNKERSGPLSEELPIFKIVAVASPPSAKTISTSSSRSAMTLTAEGLLFGQWARSS